VLSAVIITKDEADRVGHAIRSVAFADEVVVVDSGSTDGTVDLARSLGARVVEADWPGHVAQKNRALAAATGDWVLSLDADEVVSDALREAILAALRAPSADGYRVSRLNLWLGTPLRHGRWYPDRRLRIARRAGARWEGDDPHDHLVVDGVVADLTGDLVHTPYRSLGDHLGTIDRYSRVAADTLRARGVRAGPADLLLRPPWHFVRAWLLEGGFRDGLAGLVVAALGSTYTLLKWARVRGLP
jgi:glycosyltransferase involved in cell wall biosynthesis